MGLFSFLSKKPEDFENKGDAGFSKGAFGEAKIAYERALAGMEKLPGQNPAVMARVRDKLMETRESLAKQHGARADELIEAGALDEARACLMLALELTGKTDIQATIKQLLAEMTAAPPVPVYDDGVDGDWVDDEPVEGVEPSELDEFYALCGTLPEEMEEAYVSYGEPFMQGYLALIRGDFSTAAKELKQAMDGSGTQNSFIPLELANALIGLEQFEDAEELLKDFLTRHPGSLHGITSLFDLYCRTKHYGPAHDLLSSSPDSLKGQREIKLLTGRLYFLEEQFESAAEIYRELLSAPDWDEAAARSLIATLEAMEAYEAARNLAVTLLNRCAGCGQKPGPMDRLKYAELSVIVKDYSREIIDLYLGIALEAPEIRSHCYQRVAFIFNETGRPEDARAIEAMIE